MRDEFRSSLRTSEHSQHIFDSLVQQDIHATKTFDKSIQNYEIYEEEANPQTVLMCLVQKMTEDEGREGQHGYFGVNQKG